MNVISNSIEFQILLKGQAVLFVLHRWSSYSLIAKRIVEEWEKRSNRNIHLLDASEMDEGSYFYEWLEKQNFPSRRLAGYGEVFWLENGCSIGFSTAYKNRDNHESTVTLERKTTHFFNKA